MRRSDRPCELLSRPCWASWRAALATSVVPGPPSRHFPKLWELRLAERHGDRQVVLRILVALHDDTTAVVLMAGDKSGNWVEWYEMAVPTADAYYDEFLRRQQ